jgi:hypothetical protein
MLSREQLQRVAADSGFQVESYEKVHILVRLLEAVRRCRDNILAACSTLSDGASSSTSTNASTAGG